MQEELRYLKIRVSELEKELSELRAQQMSRQGSLVVGPGAEGLDSMIAENISLKNQLEQVLEFSIMLQGLMTAPCTLPVGDPPLDTMPALDNLTKVGIVPADGLTLLPRH